MRHTITERDTYWNNCYPFPVGKGWSDGALYINLNPKWKKRGKKNSRATSFRDFDVYSWNEPTNIVKPKKKVKQSETGIVLFDNGAAIQTIYFDGILSLAKKVTWKCDDITSQVWAYDDGGLLAIVQTLYIDPKIRDKALPELCQTYYCVEQGAVTEHQAIRKESWWVTKEDLPGEVKRKIKYHKEVIAGHRAKIEEHQEWIKALKEIKTHEELRGE